jgi:hypothetical protein
LGNGFADRFGRSPKVRSAKTFPDQHFIADQQLVVYVVLCRPTYSLPTDNSFPTNISLPTNSWLVYFFPTDIMLPLPFNFPEQQSDSSGFADQHLIHLHIWHCALSMQYQSGPKFNTNSNIQDKYIFHKSSVHALEKYETNAKQNN